jgi:hypothetical protein
MKHIVNIVDSRLVSGDNRCQKSFAENLNKAKMKCNKLYSVTCVGMNELDLVTC